MSEKSQDTLGQTSQPSLFVFMGLPASGKSTLARTWARKHHFSYFNFDVVHTQLADQHAAGDKGTDSPQLTQRTYDALLTYAEQELSSGRSVALDAFYGACAERARLTRLAEKIKTTPHFALCYCSEKVTRLRLAEQASGGKAEAEAEAQWQNFQKQRQKLEALDDLEPTMVVSINTECPLDQLIDQLDFAFDKRPPIKILSQ